MPPEIPPPPPEAIPILIAFVLVLGSIAVVTTAALALGWFD